MKDRIERLEKAIDALKTLNAVEIVLEYREYEHTCTAGTYCAIVLRPDTGETYQVNEPSECCSTDEYFHENGVFSRTTLIGGRVQYSDCSPDSGFEWEDGEDYAHPDNDPTGWVSSDHFLNEARKLCETKLGLSLDSAEIEIGNPKYVLENSGWELFSVSDNPVDGWVPDGVDDYDVKQVQKQIDGLIESMERELEDLEQSVVEEPPPTYKSASEIKAEKNTSKKGIK